MRWLIGAAMLVMLAMAACGGTPGPVAFDAAHEPCRFCRMVGSSGRFAAQLVVPGQDALYFDDLGCLVRYLAAPESPRGGVMFVADHRTGAWVPARQAVYVREPAVETPMGSHLMSFMSIESRDADQAAARGTPLTFEQVFGGTGGGS